MIRTWITGDSWNRSKTKMTDIQPSKVTLQTFNSCTSRPAVLQCLVGQTPIDNISKDKPNTSVTHVAGESKNMFSCVVIQESMSRKLGGNRKSAKIRYRLPLDCYTTMHSGIYVWRVGNRTQCRVLRPGCPSIQYRNWMSALWILNKV